MKVWVNGEILNADKMNTLEQSVPASATSSNGVVTFKNGAGTDLFTVTVNGSSYVKIGEDEGVVNTDKTAAQTAITLNLTASDLWTSAKIIYVSIRDKAGKRQGYCYGSDSWFINPNPVNNSATTTLATSAQFRYMYDSNGLWVASTGSTAYGVYAYDITNEGRLRVRSRYNATGSGTINGTFKVEVYALAWADGTPLT